MKIEILIICIGADFIFFLTLWITLYIYLRSYL